MDVAVRRPHGRRLAQTEFESIPERVLARRRRISPGCADRQRSYGPDDYRELPKFDLSFEWKISPGGNSGVKYLVGSAQKLVFEGNNPPVLQGSIVPGPATVLREYTSGLEYQLVDEDRNADGKEPATRSGSLYQLAGFEQSVARPAGALNQSRVIVSGSHIEHWLNGVRVVSTDITSAEFRQAAAKAPARTQRGLQTWIDHCRSPFSATPARSGFGISSCASFPTWP